MKVSNIYLEGGHLLYRVCIVSHPYTSYESFDCYTHLHRYTLSQPDPDDPQMADTQFVKKMKQACQVKNIESQIVSIEE